jgi:MoxR-like ATPase
MIEDLPRPMVDWTRREMLRACGVSLLGLNLDPFHGSEARAARPCQELQPHDLALLDRHRGFRRKIHTEMAKHGIEQAQVVDEVVMALFCGRHVLLKGVPGVAKGLTLFTLSRVLQLGFTRIQHTLDLLPEDITGSETHQGPIFTNMVLADDINCAPPRTQAVLFQAMQERQVAVGRQLVPLERPFLVLAMENPYAPEGIHPLSEGHQGRFMFNTRFTYPTADEDFASLRYAAASQPPVIDRVLDRVEIEQIQGLVRRIPVARSVIDYAVRLVKLTRPVGPSVPPFVREAVAWGGGPRATHFLLLGAKAHAVLHGQPQASIEGVQAVAPAVLRHRIVLNDWGRAAGLDTDQVIAWLLRAPRQGRGYYD